jgi:enoyl-CoA hydratase/3-hydroxyacyl-CoA dehydrogenase
MNEPRAAVVGAGNMGSGIAQKCAAEGFRVTLVDMTEEAAQRGHERIRALLGEGVERRIFSAEAASEIASRVRPTADLSALADADVVVEAVFEDLQVKRELFARLDAIVRPDAILATNTSSFLVDDVASVTEHPERVVGLHYFYHPAKNRLVEVVAGPKTSSASFERAWIFAERTGKTPIRSADSPGFVVNRYFVPWANEAVRLLAEGIADIPTIEAAAKQEFRIGMGPFELMNVTGVPIALHAATTLGERLGPFYAPAPRLADQVAQKALWPLAGEPDPSHFAEIRDRMLGATFLVAASLVAEGVATKEDTDIGARVGLRWAQGPFEIMNRVGVREAARLAEDVARRWKGMRVPSLLAAQAESGAPFSFELVRLDVSDGIAEITINRPDALNALNEQVIAQLEARFAEAESRADVRTVVLRGAGKAFVAGADVKFFVKKLDAKDVASIRAFTERAQALFRRIDESRKLVICRLDGLSLGGGSELALAADVILATEKGTLGFPETGIGIYPGLGGTQRTTRRVGIPLARWLVLTGTIVDAKTAHAIGLVDEIVPVERMGARIHELDRAGRSRTAASKSALPAELRALEQFFESADVDALLAGSAAAPSDRIAKEAGKVKWKAPVAARIADRLVRDGAARPLAEGLAMELSHLDEIFATKDAYEGLSTLGKRRPEFKGA